MVRGESMDQMEDPSWKRSCDLLVNALQSLERSTSQIRRSTNRLITPNDIAKEREKVKKVLSSTNANEVHVIQDTLTLMEKYMRLNPAQLRGQGVKLTTEAQLVLENYKKSCDAFYKRCSVVEESLRSGGGTTRVKVRDSNGSQTMTGDAYDDDESTSLLQRVAVSGSTQKEEFERDLQNEMMAERQRETAEVADDLRNINEIFEHIHSMIEGQGEALDVVERNIGAAARATRNARNHLQQARRHQETSTRDRMLLLFVLVLAFIVTIVILIR